MGKAKRAEDPQSRLHGLCHWMLSCRLCCSLQLPPPCNRAPWLKRGFRWKTLSSVPCSEGNPWSVGCCIATGRDAGSPRGFGCLTPEQSDLGASSGTGREMNFVDPCLPHKPTSQLPCPVGREVKSRISLCPTWAPQVRAEGWVQVSVGGACTERSKSRLVIMKHAACWCHCNLVPWPQTWHSGADGLGARLTHSSHWTATAAAWPLS